MTAPADSFRTITPSEANDAILEDRLFVIDVRGPAEYAQGHIEGAVNLPLANINEETASEVIDDVDEQIMVYCTVGMRSRMAARELVDMGYKNVCDLAGGINAWPFGLV